MKRLVLLAACAALAAPAFAIAQEQAPAPAEAAAPAQQAKAEKPKKICKSEADAIASRLGTKRVCRTQAEWDALEGRKAAKSDAAG